MVTISATASVDPRATIGNDVEVGPYCVVGPQAKIGRGTRLFSHVLVLGDVTLGEFNAISPSIIGGDPQDSTPLRSRATTRVEVGDHNIIREGVTIHRAGEKEDGVTRIGSHNALLSGSHVAHDCQLADRISLGQGVLLGGHVHVESYANLASGAVVVHNVTVGEYCSVGMKSKITQDVPRYMRVDGNPASVRRINVAALKRSGLGKAAIVALHEAFRLVFLAKVSLAKATEILDAHAQLTPEVARLIGFLQAQMAGKNGRSREPRGAS
jgi:UDP-N-acetylglucosamine acyltransferase